MSKDENVNIRFIQHFMKLLHSRDTFSSALLHAENLYICQQKFAIFNSQEDYQHFLLINRLFRLFQMYT